MQLAKCALLGLITLAPTSLPIWSQSTPDLTAQDAKVPAPKIWAASGQIDSDALDVMNKCRSSEGSGTWTGFQAHGVLTYGSDPTPHQVTLTVLDDGHSRLDIEATEGLISSRLSGGGGALQVGNAPIERIDARDSLRGLFTFPTALLASTRFSRFGLRSLGQVTLDGTTYNKIALSRPLPPNIRSSDLDSPVVVTDLYFSPTTGLLIKSVDMVHKIRNSLQVYKRVVTYSDFQSENGVVVPMQLDLTLNGQHAWSLKLSSMNAIPTSEGIQYFTF